MRQLAMTLVLVLLMPVVGFGLVNQAYFGVMGGITYTQNLFAKYNNGANESTIKFKPGADYAAMVGRQQGDIRYELELLSASTKAEDGYYAGTGNNKMKAFFGFANVYWFPNTGPQYFIEPYFGLGAGYADVKLPTVNPSGVLVNSASRSTLGYQVIGGMDWNVKDNINLMLDYRFIGTLRANFYETAGVEGKQSLFLQTINLGLQYRFDV